MPVVDLLVRAGLATSDTHAREPIQQHRVKCNGLPVSHETSTTRRTVLGDDGRFRLSIGRVRVTVQLLPDQTLAELLDTLPFRNSRQPRVIADLADEDDASLKIPSSMGPT